MIIQVDGVRLFALEAGQGEPALVLIHGNGGVHAAWHRQISHFSPMTRVVAIDLRGHGESGRDPSGAYSHATLVSDISAWFKALGITRWRGRAPTRACPGCWMAADRRCGGRRPATPRTWTTSWTSCWATRAEKEGLLARRVASRQPVID